MNSFNQQNRKGSLLIFVLWVLALIATFSLSVSHSVRQKIHVVERIENRSKLRQVANAGVKKAIYLLNQKKPLNGPDSLAGKWASDPVSFRDVAMGDGKFSVSYQVGSKAYYGVSDEAGKLDINVTRAIPILTRFFQIAAKLKEEDAHTIAASISDWKDEDDYPDESGAETNYYKFLNPPYAPKNANFDSLEELLFVKGVTPAIYSSVLPYITLDGSGKININTAANVVMNAFGVSDSLISKLIAYRAGKDGIARTADDRVFSDVSRVADQLNQIFQLTPEESANLKDFLQSGLMTVKSKNFRIQSTAKLSSGLGTFKISCVSDREGNILRWLEKFQTA